MKTLLDFNMDGLASLEYALRTSAYRDILQAVAYLSVFSHPDTVGQTSNRGVFPIVRGSPRRNIVRQEDGRQVMLDDNLSPTNAFMWAHIGLNRGRDIQFNHVWSKSQDAEHYTNLANICVLPAFLSKLTDTNGSVRDCLRYRAYKLYGYWPEDNEPFCPDEYDRLMWAETLPPIPDLQSAYETRMQANRMNRTVHATNQIGWLFSDFTPVPLT